METPPPDRLVPTDARQLRALAHPLRLQILGLLRMDGPATASILAVALGVTPALVSFHVRSLAEHGFVREAPELARDRRERWWRASHEGMSWNQADFLDAPERAAAAGALIGGVAEAHAEAAREWIRDAQAWPREWVESADMSDWLLELSPDRTRALHDELAAVIERYAALEREEGAAQVRAIVHLLPRRGRTAR
jgi:DNA-binding transcriptional ArsR family regulator